MRTRWLILLLSSLGLAFHTHPLPAQVRTVSPRHLHQRLLCIVPMIGVGTRLDPRRPLFAPVPTPGAKPTRTGIFGFSYQTSDDGLFAIVEFLADTPSALSPLLTDKTILKIFDSTAKKLDIETECRKYKKDFSLDHFGMGVR